MAQYNIIGTKIVREDGVAKATGALKYIGDLANLPGMIHGKIVRSIYPHAKIKSIDTTAALQLDGVIDVLTYKDVPGRNSFGIGGFDQPVLCEDKVRFYGDTVAVVLAVDEDTAARALPLVKVDYELLPSVDSMEFGMQEDAPAVQENGNIASTFSYTNGDVDKYFTDEYIVVENTYKLPYQEHAYLETEVAIARPIANGDLEIWCPGQDCFRDRSQLAPVMNMEPEQFIIHSTPLGGGFGGKLDMFLQPLVAIAAKKHQRPVKIRVDREESFLATTKRIPFKIKMKSSASKDGMLKAHKVYALADIGPFTGISVGVYNYAMENCFGAYHFPNADIKGDCVFTNNAHTGAFRGFGNPQVCFAVETQIDELAEMLNMDKVEFRLKNAVKTGQRLNYGQLHSGSDGLIEGLKALCASNLWQNREEFKANVKYPWLKRGVGIGVNQHGDGLGNLLVDEGNAAIRLEEDGTFTLMFSSEEMGQGATTTLPMIVAEKLRVPLEKIRIDNGDTSKVPDTGSITASRTTYIGGNALIIAIDNLLADIKKYLGNNAALGNDCILCDGKEYSWAEIACLLPEEQRRNEGFYAMPKTDVYMQICLHYLHSHSCQVVGVEVNTLTGKVDVLQTEIFTSAGTVINKLGYEGQVEGGVVQGEGYALMEEYRLDEGQKPLTRNFQTYLIPTICDMPEIKVTPIEIQEASGPFGAKGLGEVTMNPGAPAILNAIHDAIGIRIYELPANPEKVLAKLREVE
jgi:xanthine dehydrogenase molybdenum-binding subunit